MTRRVSMASSLLSVVILQLLWGTEAFVAVGWGDRITNSVLRSVPDEVRDELHSLQRQVDTKAAEAENVISELKSLAETLRMQLKRDDFREPGATIPSEVSKQVQQYQSFPTGDEPDLQPLLPAYRQEDRFMSSSMLKTQRRHTPEPNLEADPIDLYLRGIHSESPVQNQEKRTSTNGAAPTSIHDTTEGVIFWKRSIRSFVSNDHPFNMNEQREDLDKRWTSTFAQHQKE